MLSGDSKAVRNPQGEVRPLPGSFVQPLYLRSCALDHIPGRRACISSGVSLFGSRLTEKIRLAASECKCPAALTGNCSTTRGFSWCVRVVHSTVSFDSRAEENHEPCRVVAVERLDCRR